MRTFLTLLSLFAFHLAHAQLTSGFVTTQTVKVEKKIVGRRYVALEVKKTVGSSTPFQITLTLGDAHFYVTRDDIKRLPEALAAMKAQVNGTPTEVQLEGFGKVKVDRSCALSCLTKENGVDVLNSIEFSGKTDNHNDGWLITRFTPGSQNNSVQELFETDWTEINAWLQQALQVADKLK